MKWNSEGCGPETTTQLVPLLGCLVSACKRLPLLTLYYLCRSLPVAEHHYTVCVVWVLQVAQSCTAKGAARCDVLPVDLSQLGEVEQFARDVLDKHKQVDVLVNNAGMGAPGKNSPLSDPGAIRHRVRQRHNIIGYCMCALLVTVCAQEMVTTRYM